MNSSLYQILRIVAVLALVCVAAALATPAGRLPLALRGLRRILQRDRGSALPAEESGASSVPASRRFLAFLLVLAAIVLACL